MSGCQYPYFLKKNPWNSRSLTESGVTKFCSRCTVKCRFCVISVDLPGQHICALVTLMSTLCPWFLKLVVVSLQGQVPCWLTGKGTSWHNAEMPCIPVLCAMLTALCWYVVHAAQLTRNPGHPKEVGDGEFAQNQVKLMMVWACPSIHQVKEPYMTILTTQFQGHVTKQFVEESKKRVSQDESAWYIGVIFDECKGQIRSCLWQTLWGTWGLCISKQYWKGINEFSEYYAKWILKCSQVPACCHG